MIPTAIVLHHSLTKDSGTVSWSAIRNYHKNVLGFKDVGYHYGLELIGDHYEVLLGRMINESGAHCKQDGMNHRSLGICFVGNFDIEEPPVELWQLGIRLVSSLIRVIPTIHIDSIFGHNFFALYKTCPGFRFDVSRFRREVFEGLLPA